MSKLSRRGFVALSGASIFAALNRPRGVSATEINADGDVIARLEVRGAGGDAIIDIYLTNLTGEPMLYDRSANPPRVELEAEGSSPDVTFAEHRSDEVVLRPMPRVIRPDDVSLLPAIESHLISMQPVLPDDATFSGVLCGQTTLHLSTGDALIVELPATELPT